MDSSKNTKNYVTITRLFSFFRKTIFGYENENYSKFLIFEPRELSIPINGKTTKYK